MSLLRKKYIENSTNSDNESVESVESVESKHLYKIFYGTTLKEIAAYPSVFNMVQYGGDMDISQYKEMINNFKTDEELLFLDQNI